MSWISLNAQLAIASGALHFEHKATSVANCSYSYDPVLKASHASMAER